MKKFIKVNLKTSNGSKKIAININKIVHFGPISEKETCISLVDYGEAVVLDSFASVVFLIEEAQKR